MYKAVTDRILDPNIYNICYITYVVYVCIVFICSIFEFEWWLRDELHCAPYHHGGSEFYILPFGANKTEIITEIYVGMRYRHIKVEILSLFFFGLYIYFLIYLPQIISIWHIYFYFYGQKENKNKATHIHTHRHTHTHTYTRTNNFMININAQNFYDQKFVPFLPLVVLEHLGRKITLWSVIIKENK